MDVRSVSSKSREVTPPSRIIIPPASKSNAVGDGVDVANSRSGDTNPDKRWLVRLLLIATPTAFLCPTNRTILFPRVIAV